MEDSKLVVIAGCGYVGLTLGVTFASVGIDILFIENDKSKVKLLKEKKAHFYEDGINELINSTFKDKPINIVESISEASSFTCDYDEVYFFITLGTPFLIELQSCNTSPIYSLITEISKLEIQSLYLCLRSTVSLGFTSTIATNFPNIQNICFCPERTIEGKALQELKILPQIIAASSKASFIKVSRLFDILGVESLQASSFEAAEAVKLVNNTYRDFCFAFSNVFSDICTVNNISSKEVRSLANHSYPRSELPQPGLVGGPCLEKDPYILASNLNLESSNLILSARRFNHSFPIFKLRDFLSISKLSNNSQILVVGLAFKSFPKTNDVRGSLSLNIINYLEQLGINKKCIISYDPLVSNIPQFPWLTIYNHLTSIPDSITHMIICNMHPDIEVGFVGNFLPRINRENLSILSFIHSSIPDIGNKRDLFV